MWKAENRGTSPLQRWQNKIRTVRRYLRGWAKNQVGQNKKKKSFLLQQLDILDRKAESTLLSPQELEHKRVLSAELSGLLRVIEKLNPLCYHHKSWNTNVFCLRSFLGCLEKRNFIGSRDLKLPDFCKGTPTRDIFSL